MINAWLFAIRLYRDLNSAQEVSKGGGSSLTHSYTAWMLSQYLPVDRVSRRIPIMKRVASAAGPGWGIRTPHGQQREPKITENVLRWVILQLVMIYLNPVLNSCTHKFWKSPSSAQSHVTNWCFFYLFMRINQGPFLFVHCAASSCTRHLLQRPWRRATSSNRLGQRHQMWSLSSLQRRPVSSSEMIRMMTETCPWQELFMEIALIIMECI